MITLTTEVDFLIILKIKNKVQHSQKYAPQIFTILARVLKLSVLPSSSMKLSEFFLVNPTRFL